MGGEINRSLRLHCHFTTITRHPKSVFGIAVAVVVVV
jgi:hypothetical protein